jgi:hypothetical protein
MRDAIRMLHWRIFSGITHHYEIMVPDQAEIIYRDSTTAIIQRGGEA